MQVNGSAMDEERRMTQSLRPGLDVSVKARPTLDGRSTLRLGVRGGTGVVRLHLYVDGDLVDSWAPAPPTVDVDLGRLGDGRHAVTARAVDATGRWGGSSIIVDEPSR
jgi:hypothetical protein